MRRKTEAGCPFDSRQFTGRGVNAALRNLARQDAAYSQNSPDIPPVTSLERRRVFERTGIWAILRRRRNRLPDKVRGYAYGAPIAGMAIGSIVEGDGPAAKLRFFTQDRQPA